MQVTMQVHADSESLSLCKWVGVV